MISMWFSETVWNWIGTKSFYVWNKCILKISQRISFCCYLTSIFFLVSYKLYAIAQQSKLLLYINRKSQNLWINGIKSVTIKESTIFGFITMVIEMSRRYKFLDWKYFNYLRWRRLPCLMYETNSPHIYLCLRIGLIALIDVQMDLFLQTNWYSV